MEPQWYCYFDRIQDGPHSRPALIRRFGERLVPLHALVWGGERAAEQRWRPAREVPAFLHAATAPPLPVPRAVPMAVRPAAPTRRATAAPGIPRSPATSYRRAQPPTWPPRRSPVTPPLWTAQPLHRSVRGLATLVLIAIWLLMNFGHYLTPQPIRSRSQDQGPRPPHASGHDDGAVGLDSIRRPGTGSTPRLPTPGTAVSTHPLPIQIALADAREQMLGARWEEAVRSYSSVLASRPASLEELSERGFAYESMGFHDRALADWSRAAALSTRDAPDLYYRGLACLGLEQTALALRDFRAGVDMMPANDAGSLCRRGLMLFHLRRYEASVADYDLAIDLAPRAARAYAGRAESLRARGEIGRALSDDDEAIRLTPGFRTAYLDRADIYLSLDRQEDASRDLAAAKRLYGR